MITATISYGDSRLSIKPAMVITRGLINHVDILLQATGTLTFTDVLRWEMVITKNYDTTTQNILCAATTVAFENNILTATINANTCELSSYIGARDTTVAVVTIRGIGTNGAIVRTYTCLATVANVGYAGGDISTSAVADMVYTRARLDAILDTFRGDLGIPEIIASKVDKVAGKGLSTNDFTTADKQAIAANTAAIGDIEAALDALIGEA